jgi:hypothetical protein
MEEFIILAFGVLLGAGLALLRPITAVGVALFTIVLVALVNYGCFVNWYYWFPFLIIVGLEIPVALVWSLVSNSVRLSKQLRTLQNSQLK